MYRITVFAMLLGLSAAAQAGSEKPVVQMDRQAPVADQVRQVEKALDNGEYAEISTPSLPAPTPTAGRSASTPVPPAATCPRAAA